jgi:hypothetical protein
MPLNCENMRPVRKTSNVAQPSFERAAEASDQPIKKIA